MKQIATTLSLGLLGLLLAGTALAQPVRNGTDVFFARDVDGAAITLDGALDEAVWQQAESFTLTMDAFFAPGGGSQDFGGQVLTEPTDPVNATIHLLRDGNTLYVGVDAEDKSIGGQPVNNFFNHDGLIMSMVNRMNRENAYNGDNWFNGANTDEFFYSWLTPRGLADSVGIDPFHFGNNVVDGEPQNWMGAAVVDGVSNDDTNGTGTPTDDVGYTMEVMIDLAAFGYDMTDADGDVVPMTFGIYDLDYMWPVNPDLQYRTRAWLQNPWGGDMPWGTNYIYGSPDVTVNSGDVPMITEADLNVHQLDDGDAIVIDGQLDEPSWSSVNPQVVLQYQMSPEMLDALPGIGPYYTHWFRPGGGDEAPPVVDPTTGAITMRFEGSTLYVGLDTDDQAVSGQTQSESRYDGIRVVIRGLEDDPNSGEARFPHHQFLFVVDSTGAAVIGQEGLDENGDPRPGIEAAASLKGSGTAGDPSDVDEGYQIEVAMDLATLLGFPDDLAGEVMYVGINFFDGDDLDPAENSYGMRTWWLTERGSGPTAMAFFNVNPPVSIDDAPGEVPRAITLYGNYPNPFNPATTLRYGLPQTGEVRIHVFDLLGRAVARLEPGVQAAGLNTVPFDAAGLASGLYLYRIDLLQAGRVESSTVGRMMLLK
ncbi:MAG: T9SS type A sorting domain-containing protein [Rhodothermales bacterium]|nr:T9SS type A sorting domain-containing protein [Rhodothermales bacterium]